MKKKIFAILMAMLMSATMLASIATVTAEEENEGQETGEWETVYQMDLGDTKAPEGSKTLPDLQVYRIQKRFVWVNYYQVRYWLYNTLEFTGTFSDRCWVDSYKICDVLHNDELMWEGVNGPYYSSTFVSPGVGIHLLTVYTDFKQGDPGGDITESNEGNNEGTKWVWFST